MSVTAPADKRFRRSHVKPARRRSGWRFWRWRAAVAAVVCGFALYSAHRAVAFVAGLEIFHIKHFVVRGNGRLSNGEVLALLQGLRGRSILSIDLEDWRLAVMNSPWVADAALRRSLPSTVEVTIQERAPLAVGRINGSLYLLDDRGIAIDEYGPAYADLDLPIVDGFSSAPGEEATNAQRAMLAGRLLDALRAGNMDGQVSQIDVSDSRNAVVLLEGDTTLLRLGNEKFVERLHSYLEIAPAVRDQMPAIDYVDLRFDQRVYARPAAPVRAGSTRAQPKVGESPERSGQGRETTGARPEPARSRKSTQTG